MLICTSYDIAGIEVVITIPFGININKIIESTTYFQQKRTKFDIINMEANESEWWERENIN